MSPAWMTAARSGPISVLAVWELAGPHPSSLVTNRSELDAAVAQERQRAPSATCFADQTSRGFHLHPSHLSDPVRVRRLVLAAGLASLGLVELGVCAIRDDWLPTSLGRIAVI